MVSESKLRSTGSRETGYCPDLLPPFLGTVQIPATEGHRGNAWQHIEGGEKDRFKEGS